jgi:hypothetical protein
LPKSQVKEIRPVWHSGRASEEYKKEIRRLRDVRRQMARDAWRP